MTRLAVVAVAALLLAGCADTTGSTAPAGSTRLSSPPTGVAPSGSTPAPAGSAGTSTPRGHPGVSLTDADTGRTVTIAAGQLITVQLTGSGWKFLDPKPASVLTPASPPAVAGNTTSISYRGTRLGTATATARRGEDTFRITVTVE